jgi:hypothetical protein
MQRVRILSVDIQPEARRARWLMMALALGWLFGAAQAQAALRGLVIGIDDFGEDSPQFLVAEGARGIAVRPVETAPDAEGGLVIMPVDPTPEKPNFDAALSSGEGAANPGAPRPAPTRPAGRVIKVASLDGQFGRLAALQQQAPVALVAPDANPDLVWDPRTQDVLAGADVIARNIAPSELPGVVGRTLILDGLKQRGGQRAQAIRLLPGDGVHTKGARIEIEVSQLAHRFMVLFNLSGNGNIQLLYPLGSDPAQRLEADYSVEFQVREPFGADIIVAVTADQRLTELERLLAPSSRRINPERLAEVLANAESLDLRIGYVGLFTSP